MSQEYFISLVGIGLTVCHMAINGFKQLIHPWGIGIHLCKLIFRTD